MGSIFLLLQKFIWFHRCKGTDFLPKINIFPVVYMIHPVRDHRAWAGFRGGGRGAVVLCAKVREGAALPKNL